MIFSLPQLSKKQGQWIRGLQQKKLRTQRGYFLAEGHKQVHDFIAAGQSPSCIIITANYAAKHPELLATFKEIVWKTSPESLGKLGALKENHTIAAVFPYHLSSAITPSPSGRYFLLDRIADPSNLGALLRVADWYGLTAVVASSNSVEAYNPKAVQASMGSLAHVCLTYQDPFSFLKQCSKINLPIIATDTAQGSPPEEGMPIHGVLLMGSESHGLSHELQVFSTHQICIPRIGQAESLNVAVAAGICCDAWRRITMR